MMTTQRQLKRGRVPICLILCCMLSWGISGQEICDNGIDDDGDRLVDLNDDECSCQIIEPTSLIPNPSFEEIDCCPSGRSQLNCASEWIQASEPTTDLLHQCGWMGWEEFPPPQPFPDGEGIMGFRDGRVIMEGRAERNWKEYAGACLTSPLLPDRAYRFEFDVGFVDAQQSPPIDITFFGTRDCINLPFGTGNEAFGCPTNGPEWIKLGEVRVSGGRGNTWVTASIDIVVEDNIYAIAIGPDCGPTSSSVSTYYFFDNLLLADQELFELQISETAHPCSPDFTLSVPDNPEVEYQWYLEGVALPGEVAAKLSQHYGEGSYQVRIVDATSCRITKPYQYTIPVYRNPISAAICQDDTYDFGELRLTDPGAYVDTFRNQNNCDSIVDLDLEVIGATYDTLEASLLSGERYEIGPYGFAFDGEYPLTFTSSRGCDSLVLLKLSTFELFIPNAFSPNGDGHNDVFRPLASPAAIAGTEMRIYDRWGNLVYEGPEWDGRDRQPGVFIYSVRVDFTNGTSKQFDGGVTLVR